MMTIIIGGGNHPMPDKPTASKVEYGVTPTHIMASMTGLDFVRGIFEGKLPAPPIMHSGCTRRYPPAPATPRCN